MISREASSSKSMPHVSHNSDARALAVRVYCIEVSNGMSPTACCPNIFESEVFSMFQNGKKMCRAVGKYWRRGLAGWSQETP